MGEHFKNGHVIIGAVKQDWQDTNYVLAYLGEKRIPPEKLTKHIFQRVFPKNNLRILWEDCWRVDWRLC